MTSLQITRLLRAYEEGTLTVETVMEHCLGMAAGLPDGVWIRRLTSDEVSAYVKALIGESPATKPLYGIPFVIKDNIDLAGVPTTAACPAYAYTPAKSANVVERLIQAGAIPLGKTNLDQFATGLVGTRSPYGECPNSFHPAYVSGGSSSGSAAALAGGCCSFALGTDTAGSGRIPAAFNNLIGLKPSKGLLGASGVVPACRSLDCVSIFALDAADAESIFQVAAGRDAEDCYSRELKQAPEISGPFTFGVPRPDQLEFFGNRAYAEAFAESVKLLERAGGRSVQIDFQPFIDAGRLLYSGPWVNERYAAVGRFVEDHPDAVLPTTSRIIRSGLNIPAPEVFQAMYSLQHLKQAADRVLQKVDLLMTPTAGTCYTRAEIAAEPVALNTNLGLYTNYMNLLDYAAVAVPTVNRPPVPFGVTLVSHAGHDRKLLGIADRLHRESGLTVGRTDNKPASCPTLPDRNNVELAVCGAHLKGLPLHRELEALGASFVEATETASEYRMYAFESNGIPKPGLIHDSSKGGAIRVEIYRLSAKAFGQFVSAIPSPLGIGKLRLKTGREVCGFIAEAEVAQRGSEITELGDWRKYAK